MYNENDAGLLFNAASIPCEKFTRLCKDYGDFELSDSLFDELGMTSAQKSRLNSFLSQDSWAEKELERLASMDARFITSQSADYPVKLFALKHPPVGLYVKGPLNLALPSVSIVGTRHPSNYGLETAFLLAQRLAQNGQTVVSGGAKGIDAYSHMGALKANGCTVAVFGTGLDRIYPVDHRKLFGEIVVRGAVVSEYPLGTNGEGWRFIARNRIIAALSGRIVVVESPEGGGAIHTANNALELGRELWVVPGRISDEVCSGSNKLLHNGAGAVVSIDEFVGSREQLKLDFGRVELSEEENKVYGLIQLKGGRTTDEIAKVLEMDAADVSGAVVTLEAEGLAENRAGRYYETGMYPASGVTQPHNGPTPSAEATPSPQTRNDQPPPSDTDMRVLSFLQAHPSSTLDTIMCSLSLDISDAVSALTSLEADGQVILSGGRYSTPTPPATSATEHEALSLSEPEQRIYSFLQSHPNSTLDHIIKELNIDNEDAAIHLISLEAQNLIALSGGRYSPL